MKEKRMKFGSFLILLAGTFWGSMGLFVRYLRSFGFTPIQITAARLTFAALLFCLILLYKDPSGFRIRLRDLPLFLALGLVSVLFFTVCYFTAITIMPLSTAAILLYTSPIWVMLLSILFFREKISARKLFALLMAFGGCVLVSGLSGDGISIRGLLTGLGAGIGYALYSIFGSIALRRYSPYTVTAYTFLIAAFSSWFVSSPFSFLSALQAAGTPIPHLLLFFFLTSLVTAVIPYGAYTLGLQSVEASKAAILATIEPVVATLFGTLVFREPLRFSIVLGILLILAAVVTLNLRSKKTI